MKKLALLALSPIAAYTQSTMAEPVKNIKLVHGAFADGSGWSPVARIPGKEGYNVSVVQEPVTSLADDVVATQRVLALQKGKSLRRPQLWRNDHQRSRKPSHRCRPGLYCRLPARKRGDAANIRPPGGSIGKTPDRYLYIKPKNFHADFAADLAKNRLMLCRALRL